MKVRVRPRLSYGNVVATIALFAALSGVAVAAGLPRNSVGPNQIKRGAVGTKKLSSGAVTRPKLANGTVTATKLAPAAVNSAALADGSVTADKLAAGIPSLPEELRRGETERGMFEIGGATTFARAAISYPVMLPSEIEGHILRVGEISAECPGRQFNAKGRLVPEANPGYLCVYVASTAGSGAPTLGLVASSNSPLGHGITASFDTADPANRIFGFWAVTPG